MLLLIVLFPFLAFLLIMLLGRKFGKFGSALVSLVSLLFCFLVSLFNFYKLLVSGVVVSYNFGYWFYSGFFVVAWDFIFDPLAISMLTMISLISGLVHLYSVEYMSHDPHFTRFMSYLSLFTFFMFILVTAGNYLQMFVGWEGVGLCSYLLINFWHTRIHANLSAMKAIIINRVGDFGLTLGIVVTFYVFYTLDFSLVSLLSDSFFCHMIFFAGVELPVLDLISLLLFLGAVGKSAQLGLHTWLPDAMEGPTPVSALIHAATMVTAGVFVLVRSSFILDSSFYALSFITVMGAMTAFFGSVVGAFQYDLKRIVAYSTCSQLGYMIFSCGLSNYSLAMFHLINHAFFKALLFLSAGSVIHAFSDEQDVRKMGGLLNILPITYLSMLVGNLALIGFPYFSGFYSKDLLVEHALSFGSVSGHFAFVLGVSAAFFTAYYSYKAVFLVFLSFPRGKRVIYEKAHESAVYILLPLLILATFSIFFGEVFQDAFVSSGNFFWANSLSELNLKDFFFDTEFLFSFDKNLAVALSILGVFVSSLFYFSSLFSISLGLRALQRVFVKKWWWDSLYSQFIVKNVLWLAYMGTYKSLDKGAFELLGPRGLQQFFINLAKRINLGVQSGYLYNYSFFMLFGLIFLITFVL